MLLCKLHTAYIFPWKIIPENTASTCDTRVRKNWEDKSLIFSDVNGYFNFSLSFLKYKKTESISKIPCNLVWHHATFATKWKINVIKALKCKPFKLDATWKCYKHYNILVSLSEGQQQHTNEARYSIKECKDSVYHYLLFSYPQAAPVFFYTTSLLNEVKLHYVTQLVHNIYRIRIAAVNMGTCI